MSLYIRPVSGVDTSMDTEGAAQIYWLLVDVGLYLELTKEIHKNRARSP